MHTDLSTGQRARIVFRHTINPIYEETAAGLLKIRYPKNSRRATTECAILTGTKDTLAVVAQGKADCAWADTFDKERARQLSLHRAVKDLPRDDRGKILKVYYERTHNIKKSKSVECPCGEVLYSAAAALEHFTGHQEWQKPKP